MLSSNPTHGGITGMQQDLVITPNTSRICLVGVSTPQPARGCEGKTLVWVQVQTPAWVQTLARVRSPARVLLVH